MKQRFIKLCSILLSLLLLAQMLPLETMASETLTDQATDQAAPREETAIVGEDPARRDQYSKHYLLSNGLRLATVHADPVHYEEGGQWKEIDNTLKPASLNKTAGYTNTAGVWSVHLPGTLSADSAVTITKGQHTLRFYMAGQLRPSGDVAVAAAGAEESLAVEAVRSSAAQVQTVDLSREKAEAQYPQTVSEKLHSQLLYPQVFENTSIVYDLVSNQVKESIVIAAYSQDLRGYRYRLQTGSLVPVLQESGEILLLDPQQNTVMVMPAPYLEDAAGEYCDEVAVSLTGENGEYTLTYRLPMDWMSDSSRKYPVILDPVVKAESSMSNIADAGVRSKSPNSRYQRLYVGKSDAYGAVRAYLKFLALPQLADTDFITGAKITMYQLKDDGIKSAICAHLVTGEWEEDTITWNTKPVSEARAHDFNLLTNNVEGNKSWDITQIVRSWYAGPNNGLVFRALDKIENDTSKKYYQHRLYEKNSVYHKPSLSITYRSSIGIEPYFTYATLSAGSAGDAYIADGTGALTVVREAVSYASAANPFRLNLVYHSGYFSKSASKGAYPPVTLGLNMDLGRGWTLDVIQKLETLTLDGKAYLCYYDGDGTIHYLKKSGSTYYDEDGLGLEVVLGSDGAYTMTDAMDNKWVFTALPDITGFFLTAMEDNDGNRYEITYTDGKLMKVRQRNKGGAAIDVATMTYSTDRLTTVTDASGAAVTLSYSSNNLVTVKRSGTSVAQYAYSGNRLTQATDPLTGYALHFSYDTAGKVSHYHESGGSATGVQCDIRYASAMETTYHHYGNDRTKNTADDLYTHYLFDYSGRTVNAYTTDHTDSHVLSATDALYKENSGTDKDNNRILRTASTGVEAQNLLSKGHFEGDQTLWTRGNAQRSSAKAHFGTYSMALTLTASGTASAARASMALQAGKTYTLSAYVHTAAVSGFQNQSSGVYLQVQSGGQQFRSQVLSYATDETVDGGWVRLSVTFTAPAAGACTVSARGGGATGTAYVDDMQLEEGEGPSNYNLLENGSLQDSSLDSLWAEKSSVSIVSGQGVNTTAASARCIKIAGDPQNADAVTYQRVQINKKGAQTYVVSGWAQAFSVPDNVQLRSSAAYDHSKQFGLRATMYYSNGSEEDKWFYVPFNADVTAWQYVSFSVVPNPNLLLEYINISCVYEGNVGTAYFDNISLVSNAVSTMEYDSNGNPISTAVTGINGQSVTYDSNGNVSKVVTKTGTASTDKITQTYTYDSTFVHRLKSVTDGTTTQAMTHDGFGNVLTTTLKSASGSGKTLSSSSVYSTDGNRVTSETNGNGQTASYAYGTAFSVMAGLPTAVTDAGGSKTQTAYDSLGRVTQNTFANGAALRYTYGSGGLRQIDSNGPKTIHLSRDSFGNLLELTITQTLLASYTYGPNNGLLKQQEYANGDTVSYTYDPLGRTKTVTYEDGRVLTYRYTGDGQLSSIQDSQTGWLYQYTYDTNGRVIASAVSQGQTILLQTRQTYNANSQLTKQTWQIGSQSYSEIYTYNKTTGAVTSVTAANGHALKVVYDALQRPTKVDVPGLDRNYTYRDISSSRTTSQISTLWYGSALASAPFRYDYTYNALGNIATYNDGSHTVSYTYDNMGQLLTATGGSQDYSYTYDDYGNILTATKGSTTHTYTYGNQYWPDSLTAYDGEDITYDASGNPLSYYNGSPYTFTWVHGREMASSTAGGVSTTYSYDLNGLRTHKTSAGVTSTYHYAGGRLLREQRGTNTLDFAYDQAGQPYALTYNGTTYYYILNAQGDVTALVNASGTPVAEYTYSPYGEVLTATGSMAQINPLRYRGYYYDTETGFYYLQSRYYDPVIGRFINADTYASTGQGLFGFNMFAYCGNSPVTRIDISGQSWCEFWESIKDWLNEKKEDSEKNADKVLTVGITGSGAFGCAASISIGYTFDSKGNIGRSCTINGGGGFPSAGLGMFIASNNAPSIHHQGGWGTAAGASGGPAVIAVGGDYNTLIDKGNNRAYHGGTVTISYGLYPTFVELHGEIGYTWVRGFNIYDKAIQIVDFLLGN